MSVVARSKRTIAMCSKKVFTKLILIFSTEAAEGIMQVFKTKPAMIQMKPKLRKKEVNSNETALSSVKTGLPVIEKASPIKQKSTRQLRALITSD
jgi:hypothetical protein